MRNRRFLFLCIMVIMGDNKIIHDLQSEILNQLFAYIFIYLL